MSDTDREPGQVRSTLEALAAALGGRPKIVVRINNGSFHLFQPLVASLGLSDWVDLRGDPFIAVGAAVVDAWDLQEWVDGVNGRWTPGDRGPTSAEVSA